MEAAKNVAKAATGAGSQFARGHQVPISHQAQPGLQSEMAGPAPQNATLPTEDGGYQPYRAAGKLQGKRALITGGDSGIGRAVAVLFAMEGADVSLNYLPEEESDAQETRRLVEQAGRACHLFAADVRQPESCRRIVDAAVEALGHIDILVNNAAYQNMVHSIDDLSEEQWQRTFDTNMHPYFYLSKYALPHMRAGGSIVNSASVNAYVGRPDLLDYTASKGAIVSFTRGLSNQLLRRGIRVNCVCPGPVWTPLIPATMDAAAQDAFGSNPMGRPGQPSEVATCFVFLASQDSSLISGQSLHPNGGVVVNG